MRKFPTYSSLLLYHFSFPFSPLQTIEEFHNIFGSELKAVTGDSEKIEEVVAKVDCLLLDVETVRFDPYNPLNRSVTVHLLTYIQCRLVDARSPYVEATLLCTNT